MSGFTAIGVSIRDISPYFLSQEQLFCQTASLHIRANMFFFFLLFLSLVGECSCMFTSCRFTLSSCLEKGCPQNKKWRDEMSLTDPWIAVKSDRVFWSFAILYQTETNVGTETIKLFYSGVSIYILPYKLVWCHVSISTAMLQIPVTRIDWF